VSPGQIGPVLEIALCEFLGSLLLGPSSHIFELAPPFWCNCLCSASVTKDSLMASRIKPTLLRVALFTPRLLIGEGSNWKA
jgi:hypothetical protein